MSESIRSQRHENLEMDAVGREIERQEGEMLNNINRLRVAISKIDTSNLTDAAWLSSAKAVYDRFQMHLLTNPVMRYVARLQAHHAADIGDDAMTGNYLCPGTLYALAAYSLREFILWVKQRAAAKSTN